MAKEQISTMVHGLTDKGTMVNSDTHTASPTLCVGLGSPACAALVSAFKIVGEDWSSPIPGPATFLKGSGGRDSGGGG